MKYTFQETTEPNGSTFTIQVHKFIIFIFKGSVFIADSIFGHVDSAELTSFKKAAKNSGISINAGRAPRTGLRGRGAFLMSATAEK